MPDLICKSNGEILNAWHENTKYLPHEMATQLRSQLALLYIGHCHPIFKVCIAGNKSCLTARSVSHASGCLRAAVCFWGVGVGGAHCEKGDGVAFMEVNGSQWN